MKKQFGVLSIALLIAFVSSAQQFITKEGKIHFFSATAMENIEATSKQAVCALNTGTGKVFCKVVMTSFHFPSKFMEEHFNENYMESEKYPYGVLDMALTQPLDLKTDGVKDVVLKGTLEVHGVKHDYEIPGKITVVNGEPVHATAEFMVLLKDHNITIPTAVIAKIAESVKVDVAFDFKKYEKK
ncbi:MAG: YceI family protein [Chitinophagales bacterium]